MLNCQGHIGEIPDGAHPSRIPTLVGHRDVRAEEGTTHVLETIETVLHSVESWAVGLAASPWVFAVLVLFVVVDAFFPPVPSETLVIAVAAYAVSTGGPPLWAIVVAAAVGAVLGDSIAYLLGRHLHIRRWRVMRARRLQVAFDWAEQALAARPARFIVSARYVPVGRVAVNMTAGSIKMPAPRFLGLATLGGVTWAGYSTLIGVGSGVWLGDSPLLAMAVGVVGGIGLGYVVDLVVGRLLGRSSAGGARAAAGEAVEPAGPVVREPLAVGPSVA